MNRVSLKFGLLCSVLGVFPALTWAVQSEPAGRVGRAVIAAMTPHATATYPDKTAHDYPKGHLELREGQALSELHAINTDPHGRVCMVLTPGAMLCVRPSTSVKLDRLEMMTDGLPETGKDLQRRIELTVSHGAALLHAGPPTSNMTIMVAIPVGRVEANGGEFLVMEDQADWLVGSYSYGVSLVTSEGRQSIAEGKVLRLKRGASGQVTAKFEEAGVSPYRNRFDMCLEFFPDLDRLVFLPSGVDVGGLMAWLGTPDGIVMMGDPVLWGDVTPSRRTAGSFVSLKTPTAAVRGEAKGVWSREQIWAWYRNAGVIKGVHYIPRVAVNAIEFWQARSFNTDAIDEELKWANESGFNSVRVSLSFAEWANDPEGFKNRLKQFLAMADSHHLSVVPVLFDDHGVGGAPELGKQEEPVPGVHNSQWNPNPGRKVIEDKASWGQLEKYVRDITGTLHRDKRVLFWDLYNRPGAGGMGETSLPLLESTFQWAREAGTRQPITAAVWGDAADPVSARLMELSDLITFQSFESPIIVQSRLRACESYKRPIVCSGWLKRQAGSTFADVLPVLSEKSVGWFSRGLVKGRAQLFIPDDQKGVDGEEPKTWQQDVLWPDGKPYDTKEIELIKAFKFSN